MKLAQLKAETAKLRDSSSYRFGDATTFKVPFLRLEVELPGPRDPQVWIETLENKFGFQIEKGSSVMVVGAGNGGLCAEAVLQGAHSVLAVEDRPRYHDALNEVIRLIGELHAVESATFLKWPSGNALDDIGKWDLILFPEGLDECTTPGATLSNLCGLLLPGGQMFVEVTHGNQNYLPDPVNSFRPKREAWLTMVEEMTGQVILGETPGRAQERTIYRLGVSMKGVKKATPKTPDPLPSFPTEVEPTPVTPASFTAPVDEAPPPPPPLKTPTPPSDSEKDGRLGHMLKGPPLSEAALARHKAASPDQQDDWKDSDMPHLDQIKDTTKVTRRTKKKSKKKSKKPDAS